MKHSGRHPPAGAGSKLRHHGMCGVFKRSLLHIFTVGSNILCHFAKCQGLQYGMRALREPKMRAFLVGRHRLIC
jgi:hypothetical protein